jgi:uncharacterized protein
MSSAEIVQSFYDAFRRGDVPAALSLVDPDVLWHEAESSPYDSGPGWTGVDAVVTNLFEKMGDDWTEFSVQPSSIHEAGSVVTMRGRYVAKHRHTGKDLDCQVCHVWTVENGKLKKFEQYTDTAQLRRVMGVD